MARGVPSGGQRKSPPRVEVAVCPPFPGFLPGLVTQRCAAGVQPVSLQCVWHTEPVEDAADTVEAEAPRRDLRRTG